MVELSDWSRSLAANCTVPPSFCSVDSWTLGRRSILESGPMTLRNERSASIKDQDTLTGHSGRFGGFDVRFSRGRMAE